MNPNNEQPTQPTQPGQPLAEQPVGSPPQQVGQPVGQPTPPVATPPQPMTPQAPGMVSEDPGKTLGIIGLILAFLFGIAGLVISIIARSKSKAAGYSNGLAVAGIIVSIINMIVTTVLVVSIVFLGMTALDKAREECQRVGSFGQIRVGNEVFNCSDIL